MVTIAGAPLWITKHPAHPWHPLKLVATGGAVFHCDGCRQHGNDEHRYRCEPCNFDLHVCCAPPCRAPLKHPLFEGRTFVFRHTPPIVPGCGGRYCDACGDPVLGFMFYDGARLDLHPRCASLPERPAGEGAVLTLCRQAPARGGCRLCRQGQDGQGRSRFWCYSFYDGEPAYMHVACIMEARYAGHGQGQAAPTVVGGEVQRGLIGMGGPFQRFFSLAMTLARITFVVTTLDPTGIFTAFADF